MTAMRGTPAIPTRWTRRPSGRIWPRRRSSRRSKRTSCARSPRATEVTRPISRSVAAMLVRHAEPIKVGPARGRWRLRDDVRRRVLKELGSRERIQSALSANVSANPDDTTQRALERNRLGDDTADAHRPITRRTARMGARRRLAGSDAHHAASVAYRDSRPHRASQTLRADEPARRRIRGTRRRPENAARVCRLSAVGRRARSARPLRGPHPRGVSRASAARHLRAWRRGQIHADLEVHPRSRRSRSHDVRWRSCCWISIAARSIRRGPTRC